MTCVQGFVAAVPTASRDMFRTHAEKAMEGFRAYGLLHGAEYWGDDVPEGKMTSFPMSVQAQADETVVFARYLWPSKAIHDAAMKKAINDPRLSMDTNPMPFDGNRAIYGGFEPLLEPGSCQPGGYPDGFMCAVPKGGRKAFRRTLSSTVRWRLVLTMPGAVGDCVRPREKPLERRAARPRRSRQYQTGENAP